MGALAETLAGDATKEAICRKYTGFVWRSHDFPESDFALRSAVGHHISGLFFADRSTIMLLFVLVYR